ncbi:restriction endonuclease subunit S [Myroides odoratimimus]|uniref:restriction endonuclease subunit S n=1 Tax=Myroides odoratimimus TaxID=76832 RepID=UPI003101032F
MTKTTQYKNTSIGPIPIDWEVKKIKSVFNIFPTASYSRADLTMDDDILYIHYGDIHTKYHFHINVQNSVIPTITDDKLKKYELVKDGDLIMSDASEDYLGVGKAIEVTNLGEKKMIAGLHTFLLREKEEFFSPLFKGYVTLTENVVRQFRRLATGTKVYSISKSSLLNLYIPLPPLPEQQKIAEILSTWDKAIQETDAIIKKLEDRNKALAFSLLTGKKRIEGFEDKWDNYKLEHFFEEYSSKPNGKIDLPVFTSSKNGLMSQSDYYSGGRISSRENVDYNVIPFGFITYRSRSDDGLFTFNKNTTGYDGLISGYYPVFKVVNGNDNFFLNYLNFLKNRLTKYSTGTSQLVLSFKALKNAKFNLPSLEEQNAIAEILNTANQEVKQYQQKLEAFKLQKKGLMQQLLTGKVRTI